VSLKRPLMALAATAITTGALLSAAWPGAAGPEPVSAPGPTYVYRVPAPLGDSAQRLLTQGFDVLEDRDGADLFVLGDQQVVNRLREAGFAPVVDQVLQPPQWTPPSRKGQAPTLGALEAEETYYGGYRTVNAQYAHLSQVNAQYPDLTTVVDYGDSWRKANSAGGYDLKAICITKKVAGSCALNPNSAKPRFFVMGQLHAREITTGDVAYRWIDHLTAGYANDAEVKALLDSIEVWVVPIANPDGVEIVQQGGSSPVLQRKNAHGSGCGTGRNGIDLNRNTSSHWGSAGSSTSACAETYRGASADSEVETKALQQLWRNLYLDKRGTGNAAAPADTRGIVLSMHSYGNLVLFPWGYTNSDSGNDASLRAIARDTAAVAGGWRYGQPGEVLYNASGTTDDWVYDQLGVASFVWEIGNQSGSCSGFVPAYSCQTGTWWPKVKPMLLATAKKTTSPYGG
jgi:carboxypeptidase T